MLALLDLGTTTWPGYTPVFHSSIVNAATGCTQIGVAIAVTDDQRGTPRPQGAKCDLGAIEGDYIFSDGFGT
ncbi:MAG TPA: choice-of-anchor Q domain-containing protein [Rhodanobacteraceae bacterium]|nr:choice-of-anchor Q domain-containing protein [Rhodanobacteraceae bacterium]